MNKLLLVLLAMIFYSIDCFSQETNSTSSSRIFRKNEFSASIGTLYFISSVTLNYTPYSDLKKDCFFCPHRYRN